MNLRILSAASRDLVEGKKFYERQGEGLGAYFLDSLYSEIDSLILYAGIHRKIQKYHCLFSKRFPYAVYYKVESDEIRVYRVMDCLQDPQNILEALD
jgi:plasmid stabilization system protein ParE